MKAIGVRIMNSQPSDKSGAHGAARMGGKDRAGGLPRAVDAFPGGQNFFGHT